MLIYQNELPVERDAIQCRDGTWVFVKYRMEPARVLVQSDNEHVVRAFAALIKDGPVWEERYVKMQLIDCIPPASVWRRRDTGFLVTDGTPKPPIPSEAPAAESGVFRKGRAETIIPGPPDTPRLPVSAPVEKSGWTARMKRAAKKITGK